MAKRTIEFEDTTGPFTVKLKGDTEGDITLLVYDNRTVSRPARLHVDLESAGQVDSLGVKLQYMATELAKELAR